MKKPTPKVTSESIRDLLANVETELRHCDAADDQLGAEFERQDKVVTAELEKTPGGKDVDTDYKRLWLLNHRRHAQIGGAMAREAKARR